MISCLSVGQEHLVGIVTGKKKTLSLMWTDQSNENHLVHRKQVSKRVSCLDIGQMTQGRLGGRKWREMEVAQPDLS